MEIVDTVEGQLLVNTLLEFLTLRKGETVTLSNDRHDVDIVLKFLQDRDVDWLETVASRLDEEETAVNTGVIEEPISLGGKFLAQINTVLLLDVLHDRDPTLVIVDVVTVPGRVDDGEMETNTVFLQSVGGLDDLCGGANRLVGSELTLAFDERAVE